MTLRFYMDQHVSQAITTGLRLRGFDVLTTFEDGAHEWPDPEVLDRASALERVLFTRDHDFLRETAGRLERGIAFPGVVYAHQMDVSIGKCIEDLELIGRVSSLDELANQVLYLPL